jgi:hypothetical protein
MPSKDIYGEVPELKGDAKEALKDAMSNLGDSFSNKINGAIKSDDVRYDPEEGK